MNKTQLHAKYQKVKRKDIKFSDVVKATKDLDVKKEGDVFVLKIDGREFRNPKKNDLLRDVYVLRGYNVE
jgi:hypothetical protein